MNEAMELLIKEGRAKLAEKMAYPKVSNLRAMLETMGYTITPYTYTKPIESASDEDMELKSSYKY